MPAHRLTAPEQAPDLDVTERAVLNVLAGGGHQAVADRAGLTPANLADAVETFRRAGHDALAAQATSQWRQLYLQFNDWPSAEATASAHLLPLLHATRDGDGQPGNWWFTRKHPCWRLRVHPGNGGTENLHEGLDRLVADGYLARWWPGIYEPETAAFGGPTSMSAAHDLFTADSDAILTLPNQGKLPLGRRELSVLLCSNLMRAAGCEWYEQGDIWQRVITEEHRSHLHGTETDRLPALAGQLRTLLTADTDPGGPLLGPDGPLAPIAGWFAAFRRTGHALADAVQAGTLDRGLRRVLALHVIFHWNRCGFSLGTQSTLAAAARTAILDPPS